jgi:c-di-GMP-binding flagellar brake protein YcgR
VTVLNPEINQKTETMSGNGSLNLDFVNRRQYVRIYYPQNCPTKFLPELIIHYRAYQILDISEGGIRFYVPHMRLIHDGVVTGAIRFTDSTFVEIAGEVVRRMRNQIALKLEIGIPYSRILSEQVRLRNLEANGLITYIDK